MTFKLQAHPLVHQHAREIKLILNKLTFSVDRNGFKFFPQKTVPILLPLGRGLQIDPTLCLNKTVLPVKQEHKLLSIIVDRKLTFLPHKVAFKKKTSRSLNMLKILLRKYWGSDKMCILDIYRCLVRSCWDNGRVVNETAKELYLKKLESVQNLRLCLSTGAYRTSLVNTSYVETNESTLTNRRKMLMCAYILKIRSLASHFLPDS